MILWCVPPGGRHAAIIYLCFLTKDTEFVRENRSNSADVCQGDAISFCKNISAAKQL